MALYQEIDYLKSVGGKKYRIFNGSCIYRNFTDFIYTFETDLELYLPDSSPVCLEFNNKDYHGEVLSCEGFEITIVIYEDIGSNIRTAEFSCESWRLLEELNKRLEESLTIPEFNRDLAYTLICEGRKMSLCSQKNLKIGQDIAIKEAISKPVTIVWGPPGTGKTHTLANIAIEHYLRGNKVLIISCSNIAVDGAIIKIYEILNRLCCQKKFTVYKGDLLRYGYARKKELNRIPCLTSFELTMEKYPKLSSIKTKLQAEKAILKSKGIGGAITFEIEKKLRRIRKLIRKCESSLVRRAKIVATTISKASIDKAIYKNSSFDVVLLDEASMAYIPQACFAAGLAKKHFVCFGDFFQLSPIAQSDNPMVERWLLQDMYQHLNIIDDVNNNNYHPWLVLLNEQRRMHRCISGFVNSRVYHMLINDHPIVDVSTQDIVAKYPFNNQPISMIDLSSTCNVCSKSSDGSRYNLLSAFISFQTGLWAIENCQEDVGIITPYVAQSRLIRSMIIDYFSHEQSQSKLSCATVHQFQGSEKDVIIFDCVDSYRQTKPGILLTGHKNNNSLRLINVAVTRARGKFLTVANRVFWYNKLPFTNSILRYLLEYLKEKGEYCSGEALVNLLCSKRSMSGKIEWYNHLECMESILSDISSAKSEILMDIPEGSLFNEEELAMAFEEAQKRGVKISLRAEKPNMLKSKLSQLCRLHTFAWCPVTVIDSRITWCGVPVMDTSFFSEGYRLSIRQWPVVRFDGEKTAETITALLEMHRGRNTCQTKTFADSESFFTFIENNVKCNLCGSRMNLKKGLKAYFLACTGFPNCKNTKLIDKILVDTYIVQNRLKCKKDGYDLVAALSKHGVFVRCRNPLNSHCFDLSEI